MLKLCKLSTHLFQLKMYLRLNLRNLGKTNRRKCEIVGQMVNSFANKYVPRFVFIRCQIPYDTPNAAASAMKRIAAPFLINFIKDDLEFFCNIATLQTKRKY